METTLTTLSMVTCIISTTDIAIITARSMWLRTASRS
jgi:hypothetical protein